ncbi:hypothetical protein [Marinobacter mobilis]|uniref:Uncharacterized protein n=1 Tax=Marinobacter mobilis TaxID=488533 RepID=A0A1H2R3G8_9GAMM|nr:hypothetical protein [Marinobacter mobilis]SDW13901.1 hypothetical protein SAMN04487960_101403 [Marinobacter mobilis]
MTINLFWKASLIWLLIAALAVVNGIFREQVLVPLVGAQLALPTSGVLLALIVLAVTFVSVRWLAGPYWCVGGQWLVMTLLFEFGFGHWVADKPWPQLMQTFNVCSGDLFVLVLLVTLAAPSLMARLRGR